VTKNVNKNNADHSILFEAITLIIHYEDAAWEKLRKDIVAILGRFISVREPNIRYLALESMSRLASKSAIASYLVKEYLQTIILSMSDNDVSIRRRALDLLFVMCDTDSANEIVNELLDYLQGNDYHLKEEVVLKVAILAERFAGDLKWYIDVIIKLIELAGDYVHDEIWYRVT
jgi:AP-2 complex subunit alpha